MSIDIKVPAMGESVTEATVARWFKKEGDAVKRDEPLLELETDKVTVEVPSPADGAIESISVQQGATVTVGTVLGAIAEGVAGKTSAVPASNPQAARPVPAKAEASQEAKKPTPAQPGAPAMPSAKRIAEETGVKLGFMGFFAKACVAALKEIPNVNAEIEGDNIVYKNYYDIGIAVSTERGLVVPVVKGVDTMSLADVEKAIIDFGTRARDNRLKLEELQGGTFSITNGGVFGSLMSTPILNSPQSGILGMHKIQPRPVAVGDKVEIRPMMYLALSYDHRLVDGREAVTFLVRVKENLEDPQRLLLDV